MLKSNPAFLFATVAVQGAQDAGVLWLLKRRRSLSPVQLAWSYLCLCLVFLGVGGFCWWRQGTATVMAFALPALLAIGALFLFYARHAGDAEKILLQDGQLVIELETAGRTERAEFNRESVWVEPRHGDGSLIEVSGQGRSVRVGRHVRRELRPMLAREIRLALRAC